MEALRYPDNEITMLSKGIKRSIIVSYLCQSELNTPRTHYPCSMYIEINVKGNLVCLFIY